MSPYVFCAILALLSSGVYFSIPYIDFHLVLACLVILAAIISLLAHLVIYMGLFLFVPYGIIILVKSRDNFEKAAVGALFIAVGLLGMLTVTIMTSSLKK